MNKIINHIKEMLAVIDMLVFTYQCLINEREQIILEDYPHIPFWIYAVRHFFSADLIRSIPIISISKP